MQRLDVLGLLLLAGSAAAFAQGGAKQAPAAFSVVEATIPEMREAMEQGRTTSREIVIQSLVR